MYICGSVSVRNPAPSCAIQDLSPNAVAPFRAMKPLRNIAAWLLLATFAVGGGMGPTLHHAQHAVEQAAATQHTHAGTDGPVWCGSPTQVRTPDCAVCTARLVVVPPSLGRSGGPLVVTTGWSTTRSHLLASTVVAAPLIRGPPTVG